MLYYMSLEDSAYKSAQIQRTLWAFLLVQNFKEAPNSILLHSVLIANRPVW